MKTKRIIIHCSDIMALNGCSERTSQRRLKLVKKALNKTTDITIKEYCEFFRLPLEDVLGKILV